MAYLKLRIKRRKDERINYDPCYERVNDVKSSILENCEESADPPSTSYLNHGVYSLTIALMVMACTKRYLVLKVYDG